jgi:hypothetical protein
MVGSRGSAAVRTLRQERDEGSGPSGRIPTSPSRTLAHKTAAHGYSTEPTIRTDGGVEHRKSYIDAEPSR